MNLTASDGSALLNACLQPANQPRRRPRFTIRSVLILFLLLAILFAWWSSLRQAESQAAQQAKRLQYAQQELARSHDEIDDLRRPKRDRSRVAFGTYLDGMQLQGVTI